MTAPPRPKGGLSLYDNLIDPDDNGSTISSAPISYAHKDAPASDSTAATKKPIDPALRFQPIRRPQVKQSSKPKGLFAQTNVTNSSAVKTQSEEASRLSTKPIHSLQSSQPVGKNTLADWAATTEEDEWRYGTGEKRQRGGRKKKKRRQETQAETDWDDIYDPARPTNVDEYLRSDEKISEVREWRELLYRHRRRAEDIATSDEGDERPSYSNQFAPPPIYNTFAPPPASPPPTLPTSKDRIDEDKHAIHENQPDVKATGVPFKGTSPVPAEAITISRAPVRYDRPSETAVRDEDEEMDDRPMLGSGNNDGEEAPRSSRPGQAGFAARLMGKYGWTKGTGLGADESGIVNPLRVQVEKRRKKADADGGGWAEPGGKGKIIGGRRKEDASKFGVMSEVIVLQNMLENLPDLQNEIANGLGQEIGEECGDKYGRVERLFIDQDRRRVYIRFTNQVSALRAVNELDGRVFNGNTIQPSFYDVDKFERGIYMQ